MARKSTSPTNLEADASRPKQGGFRSGTSGRHLTKKVGPLPSDTIKEASPSSRTEQGSRVETSTGHGRRAEPRQSDVVRARIDPAVKEEAAAVLATMGLTVSDAFRILMMRIATEKTLPFSPLIPNEETIAAMRAARRGEVEPIESIDALFSSLDADD